MSGPPREEPIGLFVARVAKSLGQAFDDALAEAGGSRPTWLILLALKTRDWPSQRDIAEAVGITGATLTHHLDGLERDGLIERRRDPANRRQQVVELTAAGEQAFQRLRGAAQGFDARLRAGLGDEEVARLRATLARLHENVGP
jgi:MarR family transcriptional regulator for hemolysin